MLRRVLAGLTLAALLLPVTASAQEAGAPPGGWPAGFPEMDLPVHAGAAVAPGQRHFDLLLEFRDGSTKWVSTADTAFPALSRPAVLLGGRIYVPGDFFYQLLDGGAAHLPGGALELNDGFRAAVVQPAQNGLYPLRQALEALGWLVEWRGGRAYAFLPPSRMPQKRP